MTTQQQRTINAIHAQDEAQRFEAQQAARETSDLDPRAVLIAIKVKLSEGNIEAARKIAADYKRSK